jgi:DNA repair protein RecO (recombination protein O)
LTETSLIVHWLTRDLGRLATVAKGALRPRSPLHGKLDLFYAADFTFSRSRRSELHALREVGLRETNTGLRRDLAQLQQACYCANLVEQATEMETPLPAIFDLAVGMLAHLAVTQPSPATIFSFELRLLTELGLQPDLAESRLSPGTKQLMKTLAEGNWPMITRLRPSEPQKVEISQFLHGFLIFHLGKIPKGRNAAVGLGLR